MTIDLNRSTAMMLRIGVVLGMILIVVGLVLSVMDRGGTILHLGILVLIVSPFLGVIVSFVSLVSEKDWKWAAVAAILIAITATGVVLSL